MSLLYRGADLIYNITFKYEDTGETIDPSDFTEITATFSGGRRSIVYTLSDSEIVVDGSTIDIVMQRDDFSTKYEGLWDLVIETEEADANFEDSIRIRIGKIVDAFNLQES